MRKRNLAIIGVAGLLGLGGFTGVAVASGRGGEDSSPITGDALLRATAVALREAGGGRITETEQGDEESYYQVEVTLTDGTQLDVNLDRDFNVVKTKHEGPEDPADDAGGADG